MDDIFEIPKDSASPLSSKKDSIKIKRIKAGVSEEADMILRWIDTSIFDALHKRYLKSINLSIVLDENQPSEVYESYNFDVDYNDSNESITFNEEVLLTPQEITKLQIFKLLKRFILLTQSLPALPPKRFLFMRLLFSDRCPADYHIDHFTDCSEENSASIKIPLPVYHDIIANCGEVNSVHHQISTSLVSLSNLTKADFENEKILKLDPFSISSSSYYSVSNKVPDVIDSQVSQITKDLYTVVRNYDTKIHDGFTQIPSVQEAEPSIECSCKSRMYLQYSSIVQCDNCYRIMHKVCYSVTSNNSESFTCIDCLHDNRTINFVDMLIIFNIRKLITLLQHNKKTSLKSIKETAVLLGYNLNDFSSDDSIQMSIVNSFSILIYQGIFSLKTHKSFSHNVFKVDVEGLICNNSKVNKGKYFLSYVTKNNHHKISKFIDPSFGKENEINTMTESVASQMGDETIVEDVVSKA
ncbi:hypothetical protein PMKS-004107 [Pichia membranifaciens]|uniref:HORMA domain-containing protein n=1 Tax=Pichia membranifaciens TaxID=4926 RepID=A0A1Q2YMI8_9ASCO|nr:hypothetical protein PMKS-004107 [Pichia membranifaciens]